MPERIAGKTAARKTLGFVLLGLGGLAGAFFLFCCVGLLYGILNADIPNVPAITPFDIGLTLGAGATSLSLLAAGYWVFWGTFRPPLGLLARKLFHDLGAGEPPAPPRF
jgi:hypothetical protein